MMRKILVLLALCLMIGTVGAIPALTDYGNTTSMYLNITPSMGSQTDYQIKYILSNSSGISGYYARDNVIYTNSTTRPDWYDINATDGSDNPLPFWIENNTQTAYNATVWVKSPSVSVANTDKVKWRYGNASQTASTGNILQMSSGTGDDFNTGSLNTSQWILVASSTATMINGSAWIATTQTAGGGAMSKTMYGKNYSIVSRWGQGSFPNIATFPSVGFMDVLPTTQNVALIYMNDLSPNRFWNIQSKLSGASSSITSAIASDGSYHRTEIGRKISTVNGTVDGAIIGTTTTNIPTANLNASLSPWDSQSQVVSDWIFVRKSLDIEPTTSLYTTSSGGAPATPTVAAFSCTPTAVTIGSSTTCTDASTNTPTSWIWDFGDGNTSTSQNPTYTYPFLGTFNVSLWANNTAGGDWENKTAYIAVSNASGWNQQDIEQDGQYIATFTITDSTTGAAIPVVIVTSSSGSTYTTTNGTAYLTLPVGVYVAYFSATGYTSKSVSFIVDSDSTTAVQLVPSSTVNPYIVKYPPKDVKFHVQTLDGGSIPLAYVEATPLLTTLGSYTYVASLFGYDLGTVPLNTLSLNGTTDSHGDITFAMMTDVQYTINTTKTGYTFTRLNITPHSDNYVILADYSGSLFITNGTAPSASVTFQTFSTRVNQTTAFINISYDDVAGATTSGVFNITTTNRTGFSNNTMSRIQIANKTFTGNSSWANFTLMDKAVTGCNGKTSVIYNQTGAIVGCSNQTLVDDGSYTTGCKGYTAKGTVYETGTVWFKSVASPLAGLSPEFALFVALGIMMFTALMAGKTTAPAVTICVLFEGWVFYGMNMFVLMDGITKSGIPVVPVVLTVCTFITIVWLFSEGRKTK